MDNGPELEWLTRRLAECPAEFQRPPGNGAGNADVEAIVGDLLRDLGLDALIAADTAPFSDAQRFPPNTLSLVLVASWLLHDEWFRSRRGFARAAQQFLQTQLGDLAGLVRSERFIKDPDRREELARFALRALGLVPAGETENAANDRLTTLSSVERKRVLEATRAARLHAEKVRQAMREKAAAESAARYARE